MAGKTAKKKPGMNTGGHSRVKGESIIADPAPGTEDRTYDKYTKNKLHLPIRKV